jgi:3-oxoacid CoA-transferase subunit B
MPWTRDEMAARAAKELHDGFYVNLGIGIPTLVANHIPDDMDVTLQSENGMLGIGPVPVRGRGRRRPDQCRQADDHDAAAHELSSTQPTSFAMIRGGHINIAILGAMEVAENGDIANWMIPGKLVKGMGGAMDLVAGVKRIVVVMEHCNKKGETKVLKACTLPLTGKGVVNRIITDLCVFDVVEGGLKVIELAPGVSLQDVKENTEATIVG